MTQAGQVTEVFLPLDRMTGKPRGFAFVTFSDQAGMTEAITKFNGFEFKGRALKINEAQERPPRPSFGGGGGGFGGGGGYSGGGGGFGGGGGGGFKQPWERKKVKSKGSRKNLRARKRGGF
jgi:RNA recognition motif-containing protein